MDQVDDLQRLDLDGHSLEDRDIEPLMELGGLRQEKGADGRDRKLPLCRWAGPHR